MTPGDTVARPAASGVSGRASAAIAGTLELIEARNPELRCFVEVDTSGAVHAASISDARSQAGQEIGPLDGVPFGVKSNIACAGLEWSAGLRARLAVRATADAPIVGQLRAAGAIPIGTTNMAEAAIGATTANPVFGTCRNPRDPDRNAGGSSGGSASAVAAGMVPFALGTDTLGSVRIPAAYCGTAAWKPSAGLVDTARVVPLCREFDTVGILAPRVGDIIRVAESLGLLESAQARRSVTVVVLEGLLRGDIDDVVREAFEHAATVLQARGYGIRVERMPLPDLGRLRRALLLRCEVEASHYFAHILTNQPGSLSPATREMLEFGQRADADKLQHADDTIAAGIERLASALRPDEFLLTPTTPHVACAADDDGPQDAADFTAWVNAFGGTAVSLPGVAPDRSHPVGVQLVAPPGYDRHLLAVAAQLEEAQ